VEQEISALAKEMNGWVQMLSGPSLTLRIPAAQFEPFISKVSGMGQVIDRKVTGSDVTDQYRDLRLRLDNAEKVRVRLTALLEQAKNVQDMLAVEKELARITEEIERLKGTLAQMDDQIAFSTITVELRRAMPYRPSAGSLPFPWVRELGLTALFRFEK
jgi:hypothetical protein